MDIKERFLKYVTVHTASDENSTTAPTTQRQFNLANMLCDEMKQLGIADARVSENCYVYGSIPATKGCESKPAIGFIAHMDTSPDFSGENVKPQIIENYNGGNIALKGSDRVLSPKDFKSLNSLIGRTVITTDGTTLLGADNKAGIAEILTMCEALINSDIAHGKICIGFTPDEEVGSGADHFDVEGFGADFAYTVDGEKEGEIVYENFNAAGAVFDVKGFNVHPGSAKNTMINAILVAIEINNMLPSGETPRDTEDYEGFYHLHDMHGDVANARLEYIIRDHSKEIFGSRLSTLKHIEKLINEKYGEGTVRLTIKQQYENMTEMIKPCMHIVDNAKKAIESLGLTVSVEPIRGGTDGARLSFMGLPCPNLGTGGYAFHGPYEHVSVEGMQLASDVLLEIIKIYAK